MSPLRHSIRPFGRTDLEHWDREARRAMAAGNERDLSEALDRLSAAKAERDRRGSRRHG